MDRNSKDFKLVRKVQENMPYWANQKIEDFHKLNFSEKLEPFAEQHVWNANASINVFQVIGTDHGGYIGLTWFEFLQRGRRMIRNLTKHEANPDYYYSHEIKSPDMSYITVDGANYFVQGGNHRTTIARFEFEMTGRTLLEGVTTDTYVINHPLRILRDEITAWANTQPDSYNYKTRPERELLRREDAAGYKSDHYAVKLGLYRYEKNNHDNDWQTCDYDQAKQVFKEWKSAATVQAKPSFWGKVVGG